MLKVDDSDVRVLALGLFWGEGDGFSSCEMWLSERLTLVWCVGDLPCAEQACLRRSC